MFYNVFQITYISTLRLQNHRIKSNDTLDRIDTDIFYIQ